MQEVVKLVRMKWSSCNVGKTADPVHGSLRLVLTSHLGKPTIDLFRVFKTEPSGIQYFFKLNFTILHRYQLCVWINTFKQGTQHAQFSHSDQISLVDQDNVGKLDLLHQQFGDTSVIFITHDLGVVAQLCDTVAVMYGGKIVEYNSVKEIFGNPRHPYSQGLLASNPVFGRAKKQLHAMSGQPPDLATLQDGCAFAPRCSIALADCYINPPKKIHIAGDFQHMCSIIKVI